ncbi:MAG TPA: LemA family protein [Rudaea sp.]|nr:LemA family protein [Rudaea sp.]
MALWTLICALIALCALVAVSFNELVVARNRARTAFSDIDVELQRRHDLVPQLAAVVKGYAQHEQATLEAVAGLRVRAQAAASIAERGALETELGGRVANLLALEERYPELKASANFLALERDLVGVEDRLQDARRRYNAAVQRYNTMIERFPASLLARAFALRALDFFAADGDAAAAPDLSRA